VHGFVTVGEWAGMSVLSERDSPEEEEEEEEKKKKKKEGSVSNISSFCRL